ncbi:MAG: hypothetical protein U5N27_11525 [Rhizobium sp.]|nr:hypothetical protein [Rhizobium sp.]
MAANVGSADCYATNCVVMAEASFLAAFSQVGVEAVQNFSAGCFHGEVAFGLLLSVLVTALTQFRMARRINADSSLGQGLAPLQRDCKVISHFLVADYIRRNIRRDTLCTAIQLT